MIQTTPIRVLLVEDNPGDARLIHEMLREAGPGRFEIEQADRLDAAFECLKGSRPEVVLLDLGLPDSQGLATFERLRLEAPDVPVVVISGLDDEEVALAAVRSGGQDYLVKGQIEGPLLARVIRHAIGRHTLEAQLRTAQRMEAVGQLVAGVAHDFNNLLTVILGNSELLLRGLEPADPRRAGLGEIRSAAERAAVLIRQLLAFSRQQVLEPRVLDLNALVGDVRRLLRRVIGEDVELRIRLAPRLGAVRADPGQLEQVMLNLAVNSRDAMPGGGILTLETANLDLDEAYCRDHAAARPGPYVLLAVSDTGLGMDAATRGHIFEPFFTTKGRDHGTGLGLATVHGIVSQSGGHIWLYSEPGKGTTFKIYLPRVEAPAAPTAAAAPPARALTGSETVLVVEDEEAVRALTTKTLEARGYRVLAAASAEQALEVAQRHPERIPLVVTDVVMPGLSGGELAARLVELRPEMRVIFVSGYTDDTIAHQGVLDPGVHFLQKPFALDALARKVREVLDG
ncbi:MAG TPA: response regulator [Thermoanaerobaculia bacterium]|nr:response regulator [Thermoanaerobaculia bacterium]